MAASSQVKELTSKLEQGVKDVFSSEMFANYLRTMAQFHKYSTRNTLLIHMQRPGATHVAGFKSWTSKFKRHVKRGETAIKILAPVPFMKTEEKEALDPVTKQPILDENGAPVIEYNELHLARFKIVNVFDVSQTDGKPLPSLVQDLTGNVEQYIAFLDALRAVSPLPIVIKPMPEDTDGTCYFGKEIAIREGMSEVQTVCAIVHEITHAKLHDIESIRMTDEKAKAKDRRTEEVEAESVSYAVCQYFGIETGANSFGYLAEWSNGRELKELNTSLETIRKTAAELIESIEGKFREIVKERDIVFIIGEEQENPLTEENLPDEPTGDSLPHKNYHKFAEMFPQFTNGEYSYMKLDAGDSMMPLSLEWLDDNRISIMHTYKMNGDLMCDPMITLKIDQDARTISGSEYQQSMPPLYQRVEERGSGISVDGNGKERVVFGLEQEINDFMTQWLSNISQQGYVPVAADIEIDTETVRISFDQNGNPIFPEAETTPDVLPTENPIQLPDPIIGLDEMQKYGYTANEILPLTQARALELYDADHTVYMLHTDNTEAMIFDREEISTHNGIFGIEREEWEAALEFSEMKEQTKNSEGSREADLLYGSGNRFGIYQIPSDVDSMRDLRFASMSRLEELGLSPDRNNYNLVYSVPFDDRVEYLTDRCKVLNNINTKFNTDHPSDYEGRSVSVSDVVVLKCNGDVTSHFLDSKGFVEIAGFLGDENMQPPTVEIPAQETKPSLSQVGTSNVKILTAAERNNTPKHQKPKPTLMARLEAGKKKAAQQGHPDAQKNKTIGRVD